MSVRFHNQGLSGKLAEKITRGKRRVADFTQRMLPAEADVLAPDGSEVRLLVTASRGSMASFRLPPGAVTKAVRHASVEEVWYITGGRGRMWRKSDRDESVVEVTPGMSIDIPLGVAFQFRADGDAPIDIVGVTMPPWPGPEEAIFVDGTWEPTVD